jgi:hypothetical protein
MQGNPGPERGDIRAALDKVHTDAAARHEDGHGGARRTTANDERRADRRHSRSSKLLGMPLSEVCP